MPAISQGRGISPSGLRKLFTRLAKNAGLDALSPHDMRRTFATLALKTGAPTRIVQAAGRWKSIEMVERYSQAIKPHDMIPFSPVWRIMQTVVDLKESI